MYSIAVGRSMSLKVSLHVCYACGFDVETLNHASGPSTTRTQLTARTYKNGMEKKQILQKQ